MSKIEITNKVTGYINPSEWGSVPMKGFEHYECSRDGVVRNTRTGNMLNSAVNQKGYHRVSLSNYPESKRASVARLVIASFKGFDSDKPEVNHIDGDKNNNSLRNLEWATRMENIKHAMANNLTNGRVNKNNMKGVTLNKDGKFLVRKNINGKRYYVGYFKTKELAMEAYDAYKPTQNK